VPRMMVTSMGPVQELTLTIIEERSCVSRRLRSPLPAPFPHLLVSNGRAQVALTQPIACRQNVDARIPRPRHQLRIGPGPDRP
jgi:hypothetical protein